MAHARFSIGIDLGTTTSALAFVPLEGDAETEILPIPQWESPGSVSDADTLPSFLLRVDGGAQPLPGSRLAAPDGGERGGDRGGGDDGAAWIVGRMARKEGRRAPDRVVHSAKSWLCHHSADRAAAFLPWGSETLAETEKISPIRAAALILSALRDAWNARFAGAGADYRFNNQIIAITVPASFDAVAQELTMMAAREAGYPEGVRLLEEPQAAFYCWLEQGGDTAALWASVEPASAVEPAADPLTGRQSATGAATGSATRAAPAVEPAAATGPATGPESATFANGAADSSAAAARCALVVDVGGGTSDFSLFRLTRRGAAEPAIERIAVSDHILLGGDNVDAALAHLMEPRLSGGKGGGSGAAGSGAALSSAQWDQLIARCRDLKEQALADDPTGGEEDRFTLSIPGRGSGLIAGTLTAQATRGEIRKLLLEGFFPPCDDDEGPHQTLGALQEWGLPYAHDSAVTRHLAGFLQGQPRVDAVLFNGGTLQPAMLRARLVEQIGRWSGGAPPRLLDNPEPVLAVARGAARFGKLGQQKAQRIEAGAAHALFIEAQDSQRREAALVCILPRGSAPGEVFEIDQLNLSARINRPVRFQCRQSAREKRRRPGDLLPLGAEGFHPLPPLETVIRIDGAPGRETEAGQAGAEAAPGRETGAGQAGAEAAPGRETESATEDKTARKRVPVTLRAELNELGLLQLALVSADSDLIQSWPLAFDLRPHQGAASGPPAGGADETATGPNVEPAALERAGARLEEMFIKPLGKREKITAKRVLTSLEEILEKPRGEWNWVVVRALWPALDGVMGRRAASVEHEESWLILAGFLLRPGFGARLDAERIDALWRLREKGLIHKGKRIRLQEHILWRRVAGGLDRERQERIVNSELNALRQAKSPAPELVRLLGALERIGHEYKTELAERFIAAASELVKENKDANAYLAALGLLLNRAPLYAGPETVVSPEWVERAFDAFDRFDWSGQAMAEMQTLFLRAARLVDNRAVDLSAALRKRIARKLDKAGAPALKVERVLNFAPLAAADRGGLYGEALPPGLVLEGGG